MGGVYVVSNPRHGAAGSLNEDLLLECCHYKDPHPCQKCAHDFTFSEDVLVQVSDYGLVTNAVFGGPVSGRRGRQGTALDHEKL